MRLGILGIAFFFFQSIAGAAIPMVTPTAPSVDATAYVLLDYNSDRILASHNLDDIIEPASLTKMMTAYVIDHELKSGGIKLTDPVRISENAWHTEGSRMFVEVNKQIPVKDLLMGVIIQSGNDASVALAEHIAGTEASFAVLMNQHAKRLGMTKTNFINATGLPNKDHYTTVRDLGTLAKALIRDFPDSYAMYSEKWFTFNGIKQPNRNQLLWRDPSVDGIKTGHADKAGYCLAASAKRDNMRLISVVVGSKSDNTRAAASQALLNFGFRFYESHKLFSARQPLETPRIWMGTHKNLSLGVPYDLYITVPKGQYHQLKASLQINNHIKAPIQYGQPYGTISISLGNDIILKRPLLALENIPASGAVGKFTDYIHLSLHKVFNSELSSAVTKQPLRQNSGQG